MPTTTTPYMSLILPVPTLEPGPTWAEELVTAYETIDSHNHTSDQGVAVPSTGLNINADLYINNYNFINFRTSRYQDQGSSLSDPTDVGCVYIAGGDLYYNNDTGFPIQITAGNALNAASIGGIGGDYATSSASVYYTAAQTTFYFIQASNQVALLAGGAYSFYEDLLSGFATTVQASPSIAASYTLTLPTALPASQAVLSSNASGVMSFAVVDNSTLEISSSTLQIKDHGVTQVKKALMSTGTTVGAGNLAISSDCGNFASNTTSYVDVTNFELTITTTGRPVYISTIPLATSGANVGYFEIGGTNTTDTLNAYVKILRDGTKIAETLFSFTGPSGSFHFDVTYPPASVMFLDVVTAGTYTYKMQVYVPVSTTTITVNRCQMVVWEI